MAQKVLVIGSQGYIGSRLCGYLIDKGIYCKGIDTGFFRKSLIKKTNDFLICSKDVRNINEDEIKDFQCVVLLSAISNDPFGDLDPKLIYNPTTEYTLKIAKICKKNKIKFIFPSSCSVYGAAKLNEYLKETSTTNPQTHYSINKLQIEEGLKKLSGDGFSPISLRFATIYGMSPRIRFDVVINMFCGMAITSKEIKLNSNGNAWRPNLHIDDACETVFQCINKELNNNDLNIINVGQDIDNIKIIDIAHIVKKNVPGSKISFLNQGSIDKKSNELIIDKKINDGVDTRTYKVSFEKINKILPNLKFNWNLTSGIEDLIANLKELSLSKEIFSDRKFYRLQQIDYLYKNKFIDKNLYWISKY